MRHQKQVFKYYSETNYVISTTKQLKHSSSGQGGFSVKLRHGPEKSIYLRLSQYLTSGKKQKTQKLKKILKEQKAPKKSKKHKNLEIGAKTKMSPPKK